jgi:hypothetical protein
MQGEHCQSHEPQHKDSACAACHYLAQPVRKLYLSGIYMFVLSINDKGNVEPTPTAKSHSATLFSSAAGGCYNIENVKEQHQTEAER